MIRQVNIINDLGEILMMELDSPEKSGLVVLDIEGIGPENANINIDDTSNLEGGIFNSAKLPTRNIRFSLRFWDYPSVEQNRHLTYKFFPLKKNIRIEFITDFRSVYCNGHVESNTPKIFSKEEGCSISVLCEDPYFYDVKSDYNVIDFMVAEPMFEFPFIKNEFIDEENDSDLDRFIFGDIAGLLTNGKGYAKIINTSDYDTGCAIRLGPFTNSGSGGTYTDISIKNLTTDKEFIISSLDVPSGGPYYLYIVSFPGNKEVYMSKASHNEKINKLNSKNPESDWLYLQRGKNILYSSFLGNNPDFEGKVQYPILYGGI